MPRLSAWNVLRSGSATPLRLVDRVASEHHLDDRDRALMRRIVGTEVRRRGTLRALVAAFAKGKPSADVAAHLRIGLTQIFFLDTIPDHACVSETVNATCAALGQSKGRYVNGVLRQALREREQGSSGDPRRDIVARPWHVTRPVFRDPLEHPLLWAEDALSMPAMLYKRWVKNYGAERAQALAELALNEADLSVRVVRSERDAIAAELAAAAIETRNGQHPAILLLASGSTSALVAHPVFIAGRVTIQGESALCAAELLEAGPDETVLDVCAAPGGKSAVLAQNGARVFALDSNPTRLAPLRAGLERLECAQNVRTAACDGTSALRPNALVDAALIDVPCSNTGVLSARPGARWRFGPKSLKELCSLQLRLLAETAAHVRPGGRLVYSTCSLEPEENQRLVAGFVREQPEWALDQEVQRLPDSLENGGPLDGGYCARLVRKA